MTLSTLQQHGRYSLLALHQVHLLAEQLGLDESNSDNQAILKTIISEMMMALSPHSSGIVVDPEYGLSQLKHKSSGTGLLLPLSVTNHEIDPLAVPAITQEWGVEQIANNYGVGFLEVFYHPAEPQALLKKQMVAELMDYCQYTKIDLLVRLRMFSPTGAVMEPEAFQAAQIQALQELRNVCHAFVLDTPPSVLDAATITAELDIPWIVWLEATSHDQLKEDLRLSVESGARGFMIGGSLWPELTNLRRKDMGLDLDAMQELCKTTMRDRMIELSRIVAEEVV